MKRCRMKPVTTLFMVFAVISIVIHLLLILYGRKTHSDAQQTGFGIDILRQPVAKNARKSFTAAPVQTVRIRKDKPVSTKAEERVRRATRMKFGPVYIYGAVVGNTTTKDAWDVIRIYAIIDTTFYKDLKTNFSCCLMYKTKTRPEIIQTTPLNELIFWAKAQLRVFHFTCPNVRHQSREIPQKVGLCLTRLSCSEDKVTYVDIFQALKQPGTKLAIGTQVAYGNISAEHIIDWMETYKYLGVDKVVSYYYKDVNKRALKVLQYYHRSGFVDLYRYEPAGEDMLPRGFQNKGDQLFNDLHVTVKDAFERMSGYTYFGVMDLDEFLIPSNNRTLKQMLLHLRQRHQKAAGFVFKTQYFYMSWGKSGRINDLIFGQYVNRTGDKPRIDHPKQIYMPDYVSDGNVQVHEFIPKAEYERVIVPSSEGFIRHYRQFRKNWNSTKFNMMNKVRRVTDVSVAHWSRRIKDKIHKARRNIFAN